MQRSRGKQQNGKDQRSLQENWRYQRNISCKLGNDQGQKQEGPNRRRRNQDEVARIHRTNKKNLNESGNHNGEVTHQELDILECEVKWALGNIMTNKTSGGDEILAELFKSP